MSMNTLWMLGRKAKDLTSTDNPTGTSAALKVAGSGSQREFFGTLRGPVRLMGGAWGMDSEAVDPEAANKLKQYLQMDPSGYDWISERFNQAQRQGAMTGSPRPLVASPYEAQMAFIDMMDKLVAKKQLRDAYQTAKRGMD